MAWDELEHAASELGRPAVPFVPEQRSPERAPSVLPPVTVVVPTRNEAGNVASLVAALERHLHGQPAQVLFVDDSTDDTPAVVHRVAAGSTLPVRVLHREPAERTGGLGGAVLAGFQAVTTPWVVVMDGDLQHPADMPARLVWEAVTTGADVVVGSRYVPGGGHEGLSSGRRVAVSRGAHLVTRTLFPRRLRGVTDSMSGLFAVRLAALDGVQLRPHGFKILLEVLARTPACGSPRSRSPSGSGSAGRARPRCARACASGSTRCGCGCPSSAAVASAGWSPSARSGCRASR